MNPDKPTIIFDFDGTLGNSVELIVDLYNKHAQEYGYEPVQKSEFNELRRLGYKNAMKRKGIKMRKVPKIILKLGNEMRGRMKEVEPYAGIVDCLHALQAEGHPIGVLTSNQAAVVKEFFLQHQFPSFDFIVSEKSLFGKHRALKKIINRFGLQRSHVIYVGDEPRDVVACRKARIRVVGVSWGLGGEEGFAIAPPDVLVKTPQELLARLSEM